MTYGAKYYPIWKQHKQKLSVAQMIMLGWFCGKIWKGEFRNKRLWEHFGAASISDKLRESRLK